MVKINECDVFKSGAEVICHQVNCRGRMGSGVALTVKYTYPEVYTAYRKECEHTAIDNLLGSVLYVPVADNVVIANMFTQKDFGYDGKLYTDYDAFEKALWDIHNKYPNKKIAFPYGIGCVRGGADWNRIYSMIENIFNGDNYDVMICRLRKEEDRR